MQVYLQFYYTDMYIYADAVDTCLAVNTRIGDESPRSAVAVDVNFALGFGNLGSIYIYIYTVYRYMFCWCFVMCSQTKQRRSKGISTGTSEKTSVDD